MKNENSRGQKQSAPIKQQKQHPEVRDNIDSREGEEQLDKGGDSTHNMKEDKSKKKGRQ